MALNNDDIKQLIAILQRGLTDTEEDDISSSDETEEKPTRRKTQHRIKKQNKVKNDSNKFLSMPEMHMHKEDTVFDKKVLKSPPTPRRDPFQPIKAKCRVCGRLEKIDPNIVESIDRYKCNKCSSSAG